ncbi:hypothetical protein ES332_A01G242600v1 [Gossypium tomentosum]|uniref:Uncharacterized protein n=1 Tax=Gossypium tomentosum TaxID=34277 RepID=A0A5D2RVL7_GOSTO|nr:hypothetical protein ES332_A01G242600v1 [Gossypium tomentosum]
MIGESGPVRPRWGDESAFRFFVVVARGPSMNGGESRAPCLIQQKKYIYTQKLQGLKYPLSCTANNIYIYKITSFY